MVGSEQTWRMIEREGKDIVETCTIVLLLPSVASFTNAKRLFVETILASSAHPSLQEILFLVSEQISETVFLMITVSRLSRGTSWYLKLCHTLEAGGRQDGSLAGDDRPFKAGFQVSSQLLRG